MDLVYIWQKQGQVLLVSTNFEKLMALVTEAYPADKYATTVYGFNSDLAADKAIYVHNQRGNVVSTVLSHAVRN